MPVPIAASRRLALPIVSSIRLAPNSATLERIPMMLFFRALISAASRRFRSTKTRDKKQALEICRTWHKAALKARNGKLSVDAAREVIAQGVSDVFTAASAESLPNASIKSWCDTWLQSKSIEAEQSTHVRYARIIERFIDLIGVKAKRDISTLQTSDIARFRDREAKNFRARRLI
jgi:hypothetical protein